MTNHEMSYEDCMKMVRGMKRFQEKSPAGFTVYCCEDPSVCVKMNILKFIVYYNVRAEYVGRENLLPFAFENELVFEIVK